MQALLQRAKGSPLSILASGMDPVGAVTLLPPYAKQITDLHFATSHWADIQRFSEINSGPLPFLRTLNIDTVQGIGRNVPLFSGAVGLKEFRLHSKGSPLLNRFVFPNLTSFELSVAYPVGRFDGSLLLDFLGASSMLRTVYMKVGAAVSLEEISQQTVVVLPNVESLCLTASDDESGYKLTTHISCPSVKHTLLTRVGEKRSDDPSLEAFPNSDSWNAIIRQYTRSPIEEVTLEITTDSDHFIVCSLTFQPADTTVIRLRFEITEDDEDRDTVEWKRLFRTIYRDVFSEALRTIQDLPLPGNFKRLRIYNHAQPGYEQITHLAIELGRLITSLGALDELSISHCDMRPFYFPFFYYPGFYKSEEPVTYPSVKVLTILHPLNPFGEDFALGLVDLVKTQSELGEPFERVTVCMDGLPVDMEERLRLWVGAVDCYDVPYDEQNLGPI